MDWDTIVFIIIVSLLPLFLFIGYHKYDMKF